MTRAPAALFEIVMEETTGVGEPAKGNTNAIKERPTEVPGDVCQNFTSDFYHNVHQDRQAEAAKASAVRLASDK
ncbi:hypothetical protein E2C01_026879 [Portunus trituberculatus]|uniref:Uncharacterized protein n=1 Tax=Portunus trituberculatus TaxID=210409 RepID=A0A5B7EK02_PORTR|nr:hypothetical protein [Portunus trituberculatus]